MGFAVLPHTEIVNNTKGLMLLHVPGTLASLFYDDYSENQVSAQIVMVFASIAPVLSIMSIQRGGQRHAAGRALQTSVPV